MILLNEPFLTGDEIKMLKKTIDDGWVSTAGPMVGELEDHIKKYTGTKNVVAVMNGTSALHLALLGAGVKEGEGVIVPDFSFSATANVVRYVNAVPIFLGCEEPHLNLSPEILEEFLQTRCRRAGLGVIHKETGLKIKALIAVHLLGHPADMTRILPLAKQFKLTVIEDAAQSLGSSIEGRHTGTLSGFGALSFNGNKMITAGAGGAVLLRNTTCAERLRSLVNQAKLSGDGYRVFDVGYNYRISSLQAAFLLGQFNHLDRILRKKARIAERYSKWIEGIEGVELIDWESSECRWNRWINIIEIETRALKVPSSKVCRFLEERGVQTRRFYYPLHRQKPFRSFPNFAVDRSIRQYRCKFMIPSSAGLSAREQAQVIEQIRKLLR